MRLLGIDFGFARIGIAFAETEFGIVTPRNAMNAAGALKKDAAAISALARKEEADRIVLGLPLEDGVEGKMARICRTLGEHLTALGENVSFVDESMTSNEADTFLKEEGLKASERKKRRDAESAGLILERYMHETATK